MATRVKPPAWFWVVAVILFLWSLSACAAFYAHLTFDPNDPANPAYDRQLYRSLPSWLNYVFCFAVVTVLLGAGSLLGRSAVALPLFVVSLGAVAVQFGYTLAATDLIAVKGLVGAAGFPLVIFLMGALAIWLAATARRRGWIV